MNFRMKRRKATFARAVANRCRLTGGVGAYANASFVCYEYLKFYRPFFFTIVSAFR